jgi:hypothetical protein
MKGYYFIAHDVQDARAKRCASWIADCLGDLAIMPQQCWALGYWTQYLEHIVSKAERIIVVLTPGFLMTADPFVQYQRTLVLQEPLASAQQQDTVSRLLVVLAGECAVHLHEESVFYRVQDWVDFRSVLNAEETCQQKLLDALRPAQVLGQTASII